MGVLYISDKLFTYLPIDFYMFMLDFKYINLRRGILVMMKWLLKILGDPNEKKIKAMMGIVDHINALEPEFAAMTDEQLKAKTAEFKEILSQRPRSNNFKEDLKLEKEALDKLLPEAFATVREAGKRVLNMRHFDVQLIGGYSDILRK